MPLNPRDPPCLLQATHKFQELSKAYDTISNPEKRGRLVLPTPRMKVQSARQRMLQVRQKGLRGRLR